MLNRSDEQVTMQQVCQKGDHAFHGIWLDSAAQARMWNTIKSGYTFGTHALNNIMIIRFCRSFICKFYIQLGWTQTKFVQVEWLSV